MDKPNWGKEVITTQAEIVDSLAEHHQRFDRLEVSFGDFIAFLQEQFARVESRFVRVDEQFASVERLIGVFAERIRRDQGAYGEQRRANSKALERHDVRLDSLEESRQVVTARNDLRPRPGSPRRCSRGGRVNIRSPASSVLVTPPDVPK
jgi:hypothetical protein